MPILGASHGGNIFDANFEHLCDTSAPPVMGYKLPLLGAALTGPIVVGDVGYQIPLEHFLDTDARTYLLLTMHWSSVAGDPPGGPYTGFGGVARQVKIGMAPQGGTLPVSLWGIGICGPGYTAPMLGSSGIYFYIEQLRPFWAGDTMRWVPYYYDNGISGGNCSILSMRFDWYHVG